MRKDRKKGTKFHVESLNKLNIVQQSLILMQLLVLSAVVIVTNYFLLLRHEISNYNDAVGAYGSATTMMRLQEISSLLS